MSRERRPRGERSSLSPEDEALWQTLTASVQPLERKKTRVRNIAESEVRPAVTADKPAHAREPARDRDGIGARAYDVPPPSSAKRVTHVPPLTDLDHRKARRIAAGREKIDARIDLHGMRQAEAHAALRSFLLGCHASGRRNVLVITGKGVVTRLGSDACEESASELRERGVLRRNVPMWLAEPELRAVVVGFRSAAIRHGGEGALYVQLRARRQPRP